MKKTHDRVIKATCYLSTTKCEEFQKFG